MSNESTQSETEAPRSLERPPIEQAVTQENVFGGTGDDAETPEKEVPKTSESAPGDSDKQVSRSSSGRDRRIKRLTRRANEAEAQLAAKDAEIAELRKAFQTQPPEKPSRNDFDSDEEYAEAYADWKGAAKASVPKPKASRKNTAFEREVVAFMDSGADALGHEVWAKVNAAAKSGELVANAAMLEFVMDSEQGHAMLAELAKNKKLALEIFNERGHGAVELLQDLEKRVAVPPAEKEKPRDGQGKFKKKAPPPGPQQLRGGVSEIPKTLDDARPKGNDLRSTDLTEFMRSRREYHEKYGSRF